MDNSIIVFCDKLAAETAELNTLTHTLSAAAANGQAPDMSAVSRVASLASSVTELRKCIASALSANLRPGIDYAALPVSELRAAAEELQLNAKLCADIAGRISAACAFICDSGAPECGAIPPDTLRDQAQEAARQLDIDALRRLENSAQPYIDIYALIRGGDGAMRADPGLLSRVAAAFPQIAWYVRAQAQCRMPTSASDALSDSAVDDLRSSRSSEDQLIHAADASHTRGKARASRGSARAARDKAKPAEPAVADDSF